MNARGIGVSLLVVAGLVTACAVAYAEPASTPRNRSFSIPLGVSGQPISPSSVTTGAVTATSVDSGVVLAGDGTATNPAFEVKNHGGNGLYWDTGSSLACFTVTGAAKWCYGSGGIIPFTNGGIQLGLTGNRWGNMFSIGTYASGVASGSNGFQCDTNGCRIDFGAGASDYASSDGTTVTYAGPLASAGNVSGASVTASGANGFNGTSATALFQASAANGIAALEGNATDGAAATGIKLGNGVALTAGPDRYVATFYRDNLSTAVSRVFSDGTYQNLATVGTAASGTGITANYVGAARGWSAKTTVINTALAAAATTDVTIATTPVNTRITRLTADVTQVFTGGALSAMTVTCGNAAGGNQYLLSGSVFTATTTLGDIQAEIGAGLLSATLADMGTVSAGVPGAITISCRFTCTGANCNAATQGSVAFLVEGTTY